MLKALKHKFVIAGIGSGLLLLVAGIMLARHPTIQILDNSFHVFCVGVSHGTNHLLFEGNRFEARLRQDLSRLPLLSRIGLHMQPMPAHYFRTARDSCVFLVKYTGGFSDAELSDVRAELIDARGGKIPLRSLNVTAAKKEYVKTWVLDLVPADSRKLRLRLLLDAEGTGLADIDVAL